MDLDIKLSSNKDFFAHTPMHLAYEMSFENKVDALIYEIISEVIPTIDSTETAIFTITPDSGDPIEFDGILYKVEHLGSQNNLKQMRLYFYSKYSLKMESTEPLYGKGNVTSIAQSFYSKAGFNNFDVRDSDIALDTLLLPSTATIEEGIEYCLSRAVAGNGYMRGAVVGNRVIIRSILNGSEDLKDLPLAVNSIDDNRKRIDLDGGLNVKMVSDADNVADLTNTFEGNSSVSKNVFYSTSSSVLNNALIKATQSRIYYSNFTANVSITSWYPMLGSNIIVDENSMVAENSGLLTGKYYALSQTLLFTFGTAAAWSTCKIIKVG